MQDHQYGSYLTYLFYRDYAGSKRTSAQIAADLEKRHSRAEAKSIATRQRRKEFQAVRNELVLALLDRGDEYVCAVDGCGANRSLTIDHKIPLSRGGTDDLDNLCFMCACHNSQKRDRK